MGNCFSQRELPTRSTTNTPTFLETCALDVDHMELRDYLMNNPVQQSDLDRCLLRGIEIVQRNELELSHVAPALTTLLQSGAKWNSDALLDDQKTPYHIICESPGDHHELLALMIKLSQKTIINTQDINRCTALLYAVENANIDCIKCLLANKADVTIEAEKWQIFVHGKNTILNPIIKAIWMSGCVSKHSSVIMSDIFDLLLVAAVQRNQDHLRNCTAYILCALFTVNFHCTNELIKIGAPLDEPIHKDRYAWAYIARRGNVEMLKSMFNRGFHKESIDSDGVGVLGHAVSGGTIEAVRYLLDLRVPIPNCIPEVRTTQCEQCEENRLIIYVNNKLELCDPCMRAIRDDKLEIVKLLDEYGGQSSKSFTALRWGVIFGNVDVTSYLLNKYSYPLNMEYTKVSVSDHHEDTSIYTILTEPRVKNKIQITKLLLDHGADPTKKICSPTRTNAMMTAIVKGHLDVIAQYIRSGVSINFRSYDNFCRNVLPFEASVLHGYHDIAKMLLISGCSCGVFSLKDNHLFKNNLDPEVVKLMKEWKVEDNNVTPLKQQCRSVILNHLSPRADEKIEKLPLPRGIIKFLNISVMDDIVDAY